MRFGIERLLGILAATGKPYDIEKIKRAYEYARQMHEGQFRKSGEEYITHPISVSEIVAGLELDTDSICAALLHDTVEDCPHKTSLADLSKKFGPDVVSIVDGLTKNIQLEVEDKEEVHIENLRKMLLAMSKDVRVIFIKLCDRLHNMRTLGAKSEEKRRITALETMQVYAPLAHRLGMQRIKQELENISLSYLDPVAYDEITRLIETRYSRTQNFLDDIRQQINEKISETTEGFAIEGRIKSVYSIYRKMFMQNKRFEDIYDFYAFRVIVRNSLDCYNSMGLIHDMYSMVQGRFKDYISVPKPNMYSSLHTTLISRSGIHFEVQFRTREMHHIAEYGMAAHWKYKSGVQSKEEIDKKLEWVARLLETDDATRDPEEFLRTIKTDISHDETFVFTPKGDVKILPQGSTVIDFAYAIHSEVGNKMIGAKINGMIAPIDRIPQNGEIVEILTSSSSRGPGRDWLKIVKTGEARTKIRQWFKSERRQENIKVGRSLVEAEMRRFMSGGEGDKREIITTVARRMGIQECDDFFNIIGYGGLSAAKIAVKLRDEYERVYKPAEVPITRADQVLVSAKPKGSGGIGVIIEGEKNCMVKFAKCCSPLPGDGIIGFVTKGYGISIHKSDCYNVTSGQMSANNPDRWKSAEWENDISTGKTAGMFEAAVQIFARNKITLIADIAAMLAEMRVAILQINTNKGSADGGSNDNIVISLIVGCKNVDHCKSILSRLNALEEIVEIKRG